MAAPAGGRLFLAQGDRIYKVKDIATLQRWVVEKRVLPNDRLSRDGKSWEVVKAVAELRPFFAVLDQLKQTKRALNDAVKEITSDDLPAVPSTRGPVRPDSPSPAPRSARPPDSRPAPQQRAVIGDANEVSTSAATPVGSDLDRLSAASRRVADQASQAVEPERVLTEQAQASGGFFGDGVQSGQMGEEDDSLDGAGQSDFKSTRPLPVERPIVPGAAAASGFPGGLEGSGGVPIETVARQTRSFPTSKAPPSTVPPPDQLPAPESIAVATSDVDPDFDPNQTFSGDAYSGSSGTGARFWALLLLLTAAGVFGLWYFLLGPGAVPEGTGLPPGVIVDAAEPGEPAEPTAAANPDPSTEPEGTDPALADAGSGPDPGETAPEPTPAPTPTPAPREATTPRPKSAAAQAEPRPPPKPKTASADELMSTGDRAGDRGDFRTAAKSYEAALEVEPGNFRAAVQLGWSYVELGRNGDAIALFTKASRLRPGSAEAHYGLGLAYQGAGQKANARAQYEKVIELEPTGRDTAEVKALLRRLE